MIEHNKSDELRDHRSDDSKSPIVSIITPSFNQGLFLGETIESVLSQDFPNIEYIIIDGGSSDNSLEIIEQYSDNISYWVSEPDEGQTSAINKGWAMATGDFLTWLNADDLLLPGSISTTLEYLTNHPQVSLVYGNIFRIDENSNRIYRHRGKPFLPEDLLIKAINPIPQQGFLMRREVLVQIGMLDIELHFAMDFDYWSRMAAAGMTLHYINVDLADFRIHDESKTSVQYKVRIKDRSTILKKIFSDQSLDESYKRRNNEAQANVDKMGAYIAYKAGDLKMARSLAYRSITKSWTNSSKITIGILLASLFGSIGVKFFGSIFRLQRRSFNP